MGLRVKGQDVVQYRQGLDHVAQRRQLDDQHPQCADSVTAAGANGWTVRTDTGDGIYSASPNDIVVKVVTGIAYAAASLSSSKGVFGMVSQYSTPFVWVASCSASSCDAVSASAGPPSNGSYEAGTTVTTTTTPATTSTTTSTSTTTTTTTTTTIGATYCVNWTAANLDNIKMSTQGYIDFSAILAGRTILPTSCEGNIIGYTVSGVGTFICSIPMDFSVSPLATWDTDLLPAVTDTVLNSLIYTVYVEFTDSSYYEIINGQTNAVVIPGQLTSEYNDCPI